ncbi:hypothetical protein KKG05_10675 [bacterium]|nr:hypothetical protein [bacterium]
MSHGQMLLVIGATILFGMATLGIYRGIHTHQRTMVESEILPRAMLHAERFIEEARTRAFDETCLSGPIVSPNGLTSPDSLGVESSESYPILDDIDDFNRLDKSWQESGADFRAQIQVNYADGTLQSGISDVNYRTFMKRFTVTISSNYLDYAVTLDHLFTYY